MKEEDFADIRVLLIDDNKFFASVLIEILEGLGIKNISTAENAVQALQYVRRGNYSLVLTEWRMQPMEGREFVAAVREASDEKWSTVPIIAMTAGADKDSVFEMRDTGVNEIVVKPVSANVIRMRIVSCFERPRDFVRDDNYVGPDRRRKIDEVLVAMERRESDQKNRTTVGDRRGTGDRRVSSDRRRADRGGPDGRS